MTEKIKPGMANLIPSMQNDKKYITTTQIKLHNAR